MKTTPARRAVFLGLGGTMLAALVAPSLGLGATPRITGDDGASVVVTPGLTVRNMDVKLAIELAATERNVNVSVVGPDGVAAMTPVACLAPSSRSVDYRGNGVYTVSVQAYGLSESSCATPLGPVVTAQYTVNAGVGLGPSPAANALTRQPNGFTTTEAPIPISLNPGALSTEVKYGRNVTVGADGSIAGDVTDGFALSSSPTVAMRLDKPGEWTMVARAKGFSGTAGQFFTPWSAPVRIRAFAPFDFESSSFTDSIGPTYGYRVKVREPSATGRVSVAIASGLKKGTFRQIGKFPITKAGFVTATFRQRGAGKYRLRFRFKGSATVFPGEVTQAVKITRRIVFR
jgi:hypothetical protein